MGRSRSWADEYVEKKCDVEKAIHRIRSGQRVFVGSSCGEPQHLVRGLAAAYGNYSDIEIIRLLSMESTSLTSIANETNDQSLNIRSFYLGSASHGSLARNKRFLTPMNLSYAPRLFKTRMFPLHVALIQVSPPDDFGWMSLGVSVDITLAAALAADTVIAQVNPQMPWILGSGFIHVNDVDLIVEHEEELITIEKQRESDSGNMIARHIARIVTDGSTLQLSLGATPEETLLALSEKSDLGIHSQFITDGMVRLVSMGAITNRKKGFNDGKLVAGSAIGTKELYDFLNHNPSVDFRPADYVCDPRIISRHNRMVAINTAIAIDLTGQVAIDAFSLSLYAGVTAAHDFIKGALLAEGGKSILMLDSTYRFGKKSRVVPCLGDTAVVVPRGDINYVVSEYGCVNLLGKSYQERALAIISIAHPEFRDELFFRAKKMGLLCPDRTLSGSLHAVYPLKLEETREIMGEKVTIRPAKPVDERRIQEHFYGMEASDVFTRFFHAKSRFVREEMQGMSQIDYIRHLTLVAVVGEAGFERVVAVGEYLLGEESNMAEVAFSVIRDWQNRGLGSLLIRKLSETARENGIAGLYASILPDNRNMIRLFNTLPYQMSNVLGTEMEVSCRFDELKTGQPLAG